MMARFDVLMPTANPDAGLVLRAVLSVVGQSFPDWQLLIGGDGQDSRIAAAIAAIGDPRIVYAAFPARGKAATLNALIEQSQAPYIAYLDDDDFWYAGHLATASAAIDAQGARFLHTGGWCVSVARAEGRFRELGRHKLHMGPLSDLLLYSISHINVVHERAVLDARAGNDLRALAVLRCGREIGESDFPAAHDHAGGDERGEAGEFSAGAGKAGRCGISGAGERPGDQDGAALAARGGVGGAGAEAAGGAPDMGPA